MMKKITKLLLAGAMGLTSFGAAAATFVGERSDFRDETIYFAMTTRFYDGDPYNNTQCWDAQDKNVGDPAWRGDFKGLIEKLDYIKALGFTAVWITPVVENGSGYDYHGYHALNFSKVDHRYESEDVDFQDLIDAVHDRGMKLILDVVLQHNGNFGEEKLCKLFTRDWTANQADINACMIPYTKKDGGILEDNYLSLPGGSQYDKRLEKMKCHHNVQHDINNRYHHCLTGGNWDKPQRWWEQIAGDCVDLNTENPYVTNYLVECYTKFIAMGVDGFRIDTCGHISRLTFNKMFLPQFQAAAERYKDKRGGNPFFMYGEVCAKSEQVIYRGDDYNCSPCYYTWKENKEYAWDMSETSWDGVVALSDNFGDHVNAKSVVQSGKDDAGKSESIMRFSNNAWLDGNAYHTPDYSQHSGLNVIDFPMHWRFKNAENAFTVNTEDNKYNDATYNVVYVDSHDYGPNGMYDIRYPGSEDTWAENLSLMFTFRGIPCLYYGSEIQFRAGKPIDKGTDEALTKTGRAYFGGYIKGNINVTDFAEYTGATGNIAATLTHPLAQHIQRLNKIRAAVPALRKGQYSTKGCSGKMAFKRRYTDSKTDSYVLVAISGNATFSGVENGTYVDAVTGDTKTVTNGTLTATCPGKANLRVYVLSTAKTPAPGKVGEDTKYLYATTPGGVEQAGYDGTEEETTDIYSRYDGPGPTPGPGPGPEEPEVPIAPSMNQGEQAVFFENTTDWTGYIKCYAWNGGTKYFGEWSGTVMTYLGNKIWKITYTGSAVIPETAGVIFNVSGNQTDDFKWKNGGYYNANGYVKTIPGAGEIIIPPTPQTDYRIYFSDNGGTPWANVYTWIWTSGANYTGGNWPGTQMTRTEADGGTMWTYSFTTSDDMTGAQVIFNNGSGGNGNQTGDFEFKQNGIYNRDGLIGTGISDITFAGGMKVYAMGGVLYVNAPRAMSVAIYDASGRMTVREVNEGLNAISDLPRGFYIVNKTKVML